MSTTPRHYLKALLGGLLVAGLLIGIYALSSAFRGLVRAPGDAPITPSDRQTTAALAWKDLDGKEWRLAGQRGHVVVLNYFATWCAPCRYEMPDLAEVVKEFAPRGVVFAAISIDTEPQMGKPLVPALKEFAADNRITEPVLLADDAASPVELSGVPTTILIDPKGRIAKVIIGQFEIGELRATLEKLLTDQ